MPDTIKFFLVANAANFAHIWGGNSIQVSSEFENQPLLCKHNDSDFRILRGSE